MSDVDVGLGGRGSWFAGSEVSECLVLMWSGGTPLVCGRTGL